MLNMPGLAVLLALLFSSNAPATPKPIPSATASPQINSHKTIMDKVNDYRATQGLSPVVEDPNTCNYAQLRANELTTNFSHDGTQPPYSYSVVTENIAMTSNPDEVVDMWINSPGHAENMRRDTPYVCVRNIGAYFAYEGWKPL